MQKIRIETKSKYDVIIGRNILDNSGDILRENGVEGRLAIVSDTRVAPLYLDRVKKSLESSGYEVFTFVFEEGERSKNLNTLSSILDFFAESGLSRKDTAVALGGGVVGDITGFAAGVYMRGISYIQIPTTLLSAVDSSVGGKTAIDLKSGKNLAGVFIQPRVVVTDVDTFKTLDKKVYSDGMAEVIKTAILGDTELFGRLEEGVDDEYIVSRCVSYKGKIVSEDEFEKGARKLLNLGHTPAHAIEKLSCYKTSHGEAVAIGLEIMAKASLKNGLLKRDAKDRITALLEKCSLPILSTFSAEEIAREALFDKKRDGEFLSVIMIKDIGECIIEKIKTNELKGLIEWI